MSGLAAEHGDSAGERIRAANNNTMVAFLKSSGRWRSLLKLAGNATLMALLVAATLALRKGAIPAARRGFSCADRHIAFPTKTEFLSTSTLFVLGLMATLCVVVFSEYFVASSSRAVAVESDVGRRRAKKGKTAADAAAGPWNCASWAHSMPPWLSASLRSFATFLFGLCSTVFLTEVGKVSSGVLRPNFLALCRPNVTCDSVADKSVYIDDYVCLNGAEDEDDGRKSFPSGHASFVSFVAVFVAVYLQTRASSRTGAVFLLRPLIQLLVVSLAWLSCCSRISDNVHHWGDVVVGIALGSAVALWCVLCLVPAAASEEIGVAGNSGGGACRTRCSSDSADMKMSVRSYNAASESTAECMSVEGLKNLEAGANAPNTDQ